MPRSCRTRKPSPLCGAKQAATKLRTAWTSWIWCSRLVRRNGSLWCPPRPWPVRRLPLPPILSPARRGGREEGQAGGTPLLFTTPLPTAPFLPLPNPPLSRGPRRAFLLPPPSLLHGFPPRPPTTHPVLGIPMALLPSHSLQAREGEGIRATPRFHLLPPAFPPRPPLASVVPTIPRTHPPTHATRLSHLPPLRPP
jgi:hypothetical protein